LKYLIKDIPNQERPRERLARYGAKALNNIELLALLLKTGNKGESVLQLAKRILWTLNRPSSLLNITLEELMLIKGVGIAKASTIIAGLELYKRLFNDYNKKRSNIVDAKDVYYLFEGELTTLEEEHFYCLYLDIKNKLIAKRRLFVGGLTASVVNPRDVFKYAIRFNAPKVIFVHNHPSGDPCPSQADIMTTKKLIEGAAMIGVSVLDHVIIGNNSCFSIIANKKYQF
jgi:DNA repair protein RadC